MLLSFDTGKHKQVSEVGTIQVLEYCNSKGDSSCTDCQADTRSDPCSERLLGFPIPITPSTDKMHVMILTVGMTRMCAVVFQSRSNGTSPIASSNLASVKWGGKCNKSSFSRHARCTVVVGLLVALICQFQ